MATDPIAKHRRDVWIKMVLPIAATALVILLVLVMIFTLAVVGTWDAKQIEAVAGIMMIVCFLTPLVLVMLALNAAAVVLAVGAGKIPAGLRPVLRWVRQQSETRATQIEALTLRASRPFISMTTKWERWEQFVRKFGSNLNNDRKTEQGNRSDE